MMGGYIALTLLWLVFTYNALFDKLGTYHRWGIGRTTVVDRFVSIVGAICLTYVMLKTFAFPGLPG